MVDASASRAAHVVPADLASLPKAELHVHLEGTVRPATLDTMAKREGLHVPRDFSDLPSFIDVISGAWATMMRPGDYARLVREYCETAAAAGVRYAEVVHGAWGPPTATTVSPSPTTNPASLASTTRR